MSRTATYPRRSSAVKRSPASDQLLVALGPDGQSEVLVLTTSRPLPEVTRRLRFFCRHVIESPSWQLGEGGR